ncbi:MAG: AhpC/TSA family protein [Bacteroidota bacterium]
MRKAGLFGLLALIFSSIVLIFWQEEMRYSLPTPIPEDYVPIKIGACPNLPITQVNNTSKVGSLLHFFNPDCPCSRFNAKHFKYLVAHFSDKIDFHIVIPEGASIYKTQKLLGSQNPIHEDKHKSWSKASGVYSSPQAVILDQDASLYYRGNYNKARFCTFPGSNYVEISLNLLLRGSEAPIWEFYASRSYGCELPKEEKYYSFLPWNLPTDKQTSPWNTKDLP